MFRALTSRGLTIRGLTLRFSFIQGFLRFRVLRSEVFTCGASYLQGFLYPGAPFQRFLLSGFSYVQRSYVQGVVTYVSEL